jgi:hypothetical protein
MVVPFGIALFLSVLLPFFAGSALMIPIIAVMVIALIAGWILFLRVLRARRRGAYDAGTPDRAS